MDESLTKQAADKRALMRGRVIRWIGFLFAGVALTIGSSMTFALYGPDHFNMNYAVDGGVAIWSSASLGTTSLLSEETQDADSSGRPEFEAPAWSQMHDQPEYGTQIINEWAVGFPIRCLAGIRINRTTPDNGLAFERADGLIAGVGPDLLRSISTMNSEVHLPTRVLWLGLATNVVVIMLVVASPMFVARLWSTIVRRRRRARNKCWSCKHQFSPDSNQDQCSECGNLRNADPAPPGRRWAFYGITLGGLCVVCIASLAISVSANPLVTPAHRAARSGDMQQLQQLAADGADMNYAIGSRGQTPLMDALLWGQTEAAVYLASLGGEDSNTRTPEELTVLLCTAIRGGNAELVRLWLNTGADFTLVHQEGKKIFNPKVEVIRHGNPAMIAAAFEHGWSYCDGSAGSKDNWFNDYSLTATNEGVVRYFEGESVEGLEPLTCMDDAALQEMLIRAVKNAGGRGRFPMAAGRAIRLLQRGVPLVYEPDDLKGLFISFGMHAELSRVAVESGFDPHQRTADGSSWWFYVPSGSSPMHNLEKAPAVWAYLAELGVDPRIPREDGRLPDLYMDMDERTQPFFDFVQEVKERLEERED